jgi:hypothetical protein
VYAEPVEYVYVAPVDQVVVVSRQVLVSNGYTVYRVTRSGSNRVLWARRGPDEMVRLYLTPSGQTVAVNGLVEVRERHSNRGWQRRGSPNRVLAGINGKLKRHGRDRDRDH